MRLKARDEVRVIGDVGREGPVVVEMADDFIAGDRDVVNAALIDLRQQFAERYVPDRVRWPGCWNSITSATTRRPMMAHKARFLKCEFIF